MPLAPARSALVLVVVLLAISGAVQSQNTLCSDCNDPVAVGSPSARYSCCMAASNSRYTCFWNAPTPTSGVLNYFAAFDSRLVDTACQPFQVSWTDQSSNIALNKRVSQSSTQNGRGAAKAIDDSLSLSSYTYTALDMSPWWRLDFDAPATVKSVVIWNVNDGTCCSTCSLAACQGRLVPFTVTAYNEDGVSLASTTFRTVQESYNWIPVSGSSPLSGVEYIVVSLPGRQANLHLREVQVYGFLEVPPVPVNVTSCTMVNGLPSILSVGPTGGWAHCAIDWSAGSNITFTVRRNAAAEAIAAGCNPDVYFRAGIPSTSSKYYSRQMAAFYYSDSLAYTVDFGRSTYYWAPPADLGTWYVSVFVAPLTVLGATCSVTAIAAFSPPAITTVAEPHMLSASQTNVVFGSTGYVNNLVANYTITSPVNSVISLVFTTFCTERLISEWYDRVCVYDGSSSSARLLGCASGCSGHPTNDTNLASTLPRISSAGSLTPTAIRSSSNAMFITFVSNSRQTLSGWTVSASLVNVASTVNRCAAWYNVSSPSFSWLGVTGSSQFLNTPFGITYSDSCSPSTDQCYVLTTQGATYSVTSCYGGSCANGACTSPPSLLITQPRDQQVVLRSQGSANYRLRVAYNVSFFDVPPNFVYFQIDASTAREALITSVSSRIGTFEADLSPGSHTVAVHLRDYKDTSNIRFQTSKVVNVLSPNLTISYPSPGTAFNRTRVDGVRIPVAFSVSDFSLAGGQVAPSNVYFVALVDNVATVFYNVTSGTLDAPSNLTVTGLEPRSSSYMLQIQLRQYDNFTNTDKLIAFASVDVRVVSIVVPGCTFPLADNYDPLANSNTVPCIIPAIVGCSDPSALNFNRSAELSGRGTTEQCTPRHATLGWPCCLPRNWNPDYILDPVNGCTNPSAFNFNPSANRDDGTCVFITPIYGCRDPDALNYDLNANRDGGVCIKKVEGCTDPTALNFNPLANFNSDASKCVTKVVGCMNPLDDAYSPAANVHNAQYCTGSVGCTDPLAENFDPRATSDDGLQCIQPFGCMASYTTAEEMDTRFVGRVVVYARNAHATLYNWTLQFKISDDSFIEQASELDVAHRRSYLPMTLADRLHRQFLVYTNLPDRVDLFKHLEGYVGDSPRDDGSYCVPCSPPGSDANVDGLIRSLTLRFNGKADAAIRVVHPRSGRVLFTSIVHPGHTITFNQTSSATSSAFSSDGNPTTQAFDTSAASGSASGALDGVFLIGPEVQVYVDDVLDATFPTACQYAVGPGLDIGQFTVVRGMTVGFGDLCPVKDLYPASDALQAGSYILVTPTRDCQEIPHQGSFEFLFLGRRTNGATSTNATGFLLNGKRCGATSYCPLDCNGRGACRDTACVCNAGFSGEACEIDCTTSCSGRGTICDRRSPGVCVCNSGFTGAKCEYSCRGVCSNQGTLCNATAWMAAAQSAQDLFTGIHDSTAISPCLCDAGFYGDRCQFNCFSACGGSARGTVCDPAGNGECVCKPGYTGFSCELWSCDSVKNCNGNGRCTGNQTCTCATNWSGPACDVWTGASVRPGRVFDGPAEGIDIDYQTSLTVCGNWEPFRSSLSNAADNLDTPAMAIDRYQVAIGDNSTGSPNAIVDWFDVDRITTSACVVLNRTSVSGYSPARVITFNVRAIQSQGTFGRPSSLAGPLASVPSSVASSDGVQIDSSAPAFAGDDKVRILHALYNTEADFQIAGTMKVTFAACVDWDTPVVDVQVAVGTNPLSDNVFPWMSLRPPAVSLLTSSVLSAPLSVAFTSAYGIMTHDYARFRGRTAPSISSTMINLPFSVSTGSVIYASVRCINAAGLNSTRVSKAVTIDKRRPNFGAVMDGFGIEPDNSRKDTDYQFDTTAVWASWGTVVDTNGAIRRLEWGVGTAPFLTNVNDWSDLSLSQLRNLASDFPTALSARNLNLAQNRYYVSLRATDAAGLTRTIATNGFNVRTDPANCDGVTPFTIYNDALSANFSIVDGATNTVVLQDTTYARGGSGSSMSFVPFNNSLILAVLGNRAFPNPNLYDAIQFYVHGGNATAGQRLQFTAFVDGKFAGVFSFADLLALSGSRGFLSPGKWHKFVIPFSAFNFKVLNEPVTYPRARSLVFVIEGINQASSESSGVNSARVYVDDIQYVRSSCYGCDNQPYSGTAIDECGRCSAPGATCCGHGGVTPRRVFDDAISGDFTCTMTGSVGISSTFSRHGSTSLKFNPTTDRITIMSRKSSKDPLQSHYAAVYKGYSNPNNTKADTTPSAAPSKPLDCATCSGGVTHFTFRYLGTTVSTQVGLVITSMDGSVQYLNIPSSLQPGQNFTVNAGLRSDLSNARRAIDDSALQVFGTSINIYFGRLISGVPVFHATLNTSCNFAFGPGLKIGSFEILSGYSLYGGKICPLTCQSCSGGVHRIKFRYTGTSPQNFKVRSSSFFTGANYNMYFSMTNPGDTFEVYTDGTHRTFGNYVWVCPDSVTCPDPNSLTVGYVMGQNREGLINTACGARIGPGWRLEGLPEIEVVEAYSTIGGPTCENTCSACAGGITRVTLQYTGLISLSNLSVKQQATSLKVFDTNNVAKASSFSLSPNETFWIAVQPGAGDSITISRQMSAVSFIPHFRLDLVSCTTSASSYIAPPADPALDYLAGSSMSGVGNFRILDPVFSAVGGRVCSVTGGTCTSGISSLSIRYIGATPSTLTIKSQDMAAVTSFSFDPALGTVSSGTTFVVNSDPQFATAFGGALKITHDVSGTVSTIATDCSRPIGVGSVIDGMYLVTGGRFNRGGSLTPISCGPCRGGVSSLELQFKGTNPTLIEVFDRFNGSLVFSGQVDPAVNSGKFNVFPSPGNSAFNGSLLVSAGTFGSITIDTTCSTAIGVGLNLGLFVVTGGSSLSNGPLCPMKCDSWTGCTGIRELKFRYTGNSTATSIRVYTGAGSRTDFRANETSSVSHLLTLSNVAPNTEFTVAPTLAHYDSLGSLITLAINGSRDSDIVVDCSHAIGPNYRPSANFVVLTAQNSAGVPLCDVGGTECLSAKTCGECVGAVTRLKLKYLAKHLGNSSLANDVFNSDFVEIFQLSSPYENNRLAFSGRVRENQEIALLAPPGETLEKSLMVFVNGYQHTVIDTACTHRFGVGFRRGDFVVVDGFSSAGGVLAPYVCDTCKIGINRVAFQYEGTESPVRVHIYRYSFAQRKTTGLAFNDTIETGDIINVHAGSDLNAVFGESIQILVDGNLHATIYTDCSRVFGPGARTDDFVLLEAASLGGGLLCPAEDTCMLFNAPEAKPPASFTPTLFNEIQFYIRGATAASVRVNSTDLRLTLVDQEGLNLGDGVYVDDFLDKSADATANTNWTKVAVPFSALLTESYFMLQSVGTSRCMSSQGTKQPGDHLQQFTCNHENIYQRWIWEHGDSTIDYALLRNVGTGQCASRSGEPALYDDSWRSGQVWIILAKCDINDDRQRFKWFNGDLIINKDWRVSITVDDSAGSSVADGAGLLLRSILGANAKWKYFTDVTYGGTGQGSPCVFPFTYKGVVYTKCTRVDNHRDWCFTDPDYAPRRRWGFCLSQFHTSDSSLAAGINMFAESPTGGVGPYVNAHPTLYIDDVAFVNRQCAGTTTNANIAFHKPTSCSSTYGPQYECDMIVDGIKTNYSRRWASAIATNYADEFVNIDLEFDHRVSTVRIYWAAPAATFDVSILARTDSLNALSPLTWRTVASVEANTAFVTVHTVPLALVAQQIRVQMKAISGQTVFSIYEIEVEGENIRGTIASTQCAFSYGSSCYSFSSGVNVTKANARIACNNLGGSLAVLAGEELLHVTRLFGAQQRWVESYNGDGDTLIPTTVTQNGADGIPVTSTVLVPQCASRNTTHTILNACAGIRLPYMCKLPIDSDAFMAGYTSSKMCNALNCPASPYNIAPTVNVAPDVYVNEGFEFSLDVWFTDPDSTSFYALIAWDDDSAERVEVPAATPRQFKLVHSYNRPGVYRATVTVADDQAGTSTAVVNVHVFNVAPRVNASQSVQCYEASPCVINVPFADDGFGDTHKLFVIWEDDYGEEDHNDNNILLKSASGETYNGYFSGTPVYQPVTQFYQAPTGSSNLNVAFTFSQAGVPRHGRCKITVTDSYGANATQVVHVSIGTSRLRQYVTLAQRALAIVNGTNGANLTYGFLTSYGGQTLANFVATHLNWADNSSLALVNVSMSVTDAVYPRTPRVSLNGRARQISELGFLTPVDVSINFFGSQAGNELAIVISIPATLPRRELGVDNKTWVTVQRPWRPDYSFENTTIFSSWLGSFDFSAGSYMLLSSIAMTSKTATDLFGSSLGQAQEDRPIVAVDASDLYRLVVGSTVSSAQSLFGSAVTAEVIQLGLNLIGSATNNGRVVGFDSFSKLLAPIPARILNTTTSMTPFSTALPIWGGFLLDRGYNFLSSVPSVASFGTAVSSLFRINTRAPIDLFNEGGRAISGPMITSNVVLNIGDLSPNPFASSLANRLSVVSLNFLLSLHLRYGSPGTFIVERARYTVERSGHGSALLEGSLIDPADWPVYNRNWMSLSRVRLTATLNTVNSDRIQSARLDGIMRLATPWEAVNETRVPVTVVTRLSSVQYRDGLGVIVNVTRSLESALRTTPALPLRLTSIGNLTSFLWYGNVASAPYRGRADLNINPNRGVDFALATTNFADLGLTEGVTLATGGTLKNWLLEELVGFTESLGLTSALSFNATLRFQLFNRTLGDGRTHWLTLVPTAYNLVSGGAFRVHSATFLVSFSHSNAGSVPARPNFQFVADSGLRIAGNTWRNRVRLTLKASWTSGYSINLYGSSAAAWAPFAEPWIVLDNIQGRWQLSSGCWNFAALGFTTLDACATNRAASIEYAKQFFLEGTYKFTLRPSTPVVLPVDIRVNRNPVTLALDALIIPRLPVFTGTNSTYLNFIRSILANRLSLDADAFDQVLASLMVSGSTYALPAGSNLLNLKYAKSVVGASFPASFANMTNEYSTMVVPNINSTFLTASATVQPYVYMLLSSSDVIQGSNVFKRGITVFDSLKVVSPLNDEYLNYMPGVNVSNNDIVNLVMFIPFTEAVTPSGASLSGPALSAGNSTASARVALEVSIANTTTTASSAPVFKLVSSDGARIEIWKMRPTVLIRGSSCPLYQFDCHRAVYVPSMTGPDVDGTVAGVRVEVLSEQPFEFYVQDCRSFPCNAYRQRFDCGACPAGFTGNSTGGCIANANPACNPLNCRNGTWDASQLSCVCSTGWRNSDRKNPCTFCNLNYYPEVPGQTYGVTNTTGYCSVYCDTTTCPTGVCDKMGACRTCGTFGYWNATAKGARGVTFDFRDCFCPASRQHGPSAACSQCSPDYYPKTPDDVLGGIAGLQPSQYCTVLCSPLNCNGTCTLNGTCTPPSPFANLNQFQRFFYQNLTDQCPQAADNLIARFVADRPTAVLPFTRDDYLGSCYRDPLYFPMTDAERYCIFNTTSYEDFYAFNLNPAGATTTKFYSCLIAAQNFLDSELRKVASTASAASAAAATAAPSATSSGGSRRRDVGQEQAPFKPVKFGHI